MWIKLIICLFIIYLNTIKSHPHANLTVHFSPGNDFTTQFNAAFEQAITNPHFVDLNGNNHTLSQSAIIHIQLEGDHNTLHVVDIPNTLKGTFTI